MDSIDHSTGKYRGFMLISRPHREPGLLYTLIRCLRRMGMFVGAIWVIAKERRGTFQAPVASEPSKFRLLRTLNFILGKAEDANKSLNTSLQCYISIMGEELLKKFPGVLLPNVSFGYSSGIVMSSRTCGSIFLEAFCFLLLHAADSRTDPLKALMWELGEWVPPVEKCIFKFNSKEDLKAWHLYSDSEYGGLSSASLEIKDRGNGSDYNVFDHEIVSIVTKHTNVSQSCMYMYISRFDMIFIFVFRLCFGFFELVSDVYLCILFVYWFLELDVV